MTDPAGQSLWSLRTLSIRHDRGAVFRRTWTGKVQMALFLKPGNAFTKPVHCPKMSQVTVILKLGFE